jgi:hypothetical protein
VILKKRGFEKSFAKKLSCGKIGIDIRVSVYQTQGVSALPYTSIQRPLLNLKKGLMGKYHCQR